MDFVLLHVLVHVDPLFVCVERGRIGRGPRGARPGEDWRVEVGVGVRGGLVGFVLLHVLLHVDPLPVCVWEEKGRINV